VAAFIAEPIQGVGGFIEAPPGTSSGSKRSWTRPASCLSPTRCRRRSDDGEPLLGDRAFDAEPDLITMAKGLGNGLSIGAVMGRAEIIDSISPNLHVSTFGGNHLSSAGALANLNYILENDLQRNADEVGGYLKDRLLKMAEKHPVIGEVRGRGLMLGMEMVGSNGEPDPRAAVALCRFAGSAGCSSVRGA
jgi:4-aminobutyrate aminotransferase